MELQDFISKIRTLVILNNVINFILIYFKVIK